MHAQQLIALQQPIQSVIMPVDVLLLVAIIHVSVKHTHSQKGETMTIDSRNQIEQHLRFSRYHLSWLSILGLISTIAICCGVFQLHLLLTVLTFDV